MFRNWDGCRRRSGAGTSSNFSYIFFRSLLLLFSYSRWLLWTSLDSMRDDVDEADSNVCGRRIIDVKLVAERLGLDCYGCGEKLHPGYNIAGKIEVNRSAHLLQVAI